MSIAAKQSIDRPVSKIVWVLLSLLSVALFTRGWRIGDPDIHIDEQFYLLVGDRMWQGALPYVDIWDRKPILLFLIYAALRPLSPDGIAAYQIGALVFATATAFMIVLIAQRFASLRGAWLAGAAYLVYLPLLGGAGGQAPVFYNLLMAIGAWEVFRACEADDSACIWRHGLRCMLCAGLAIQVKYIAMIEGIGFGLWLTILMIRQARGFAVRIVPRVAIWIAVAVAPTLIAFTFYMLIGHGLAFAQANFLSIFQKHQPADFPSADILLITSFKLAPLLFVAAFSLLHILRQRPVDLSLSFLLLWTSFAIAGFFALGNYYDHYALPLLVPVAILCAPLLATPVRGPLAIAVFEAFAIWVFGFPPDALKKAHEHQIEAMAEAAQPYMSRGCLYLFDAPPVIYLLTHSCLPSRYAFPGHLNEAAEAEAVDATHAMADLLATRPPAIFYADRPLRTPRNLTTKAMLEDVLTRDYQATASFPQGFPSRWQVLYVRKDLLPPNEMPRR